MKKIFLFLIIVFFLIWPSAQAAKKPKAIALKPIGIAKINDKDLTIKEITPGLPAEKSGLKVGDRIKRVNKRNFHSYKKLRSYLNSLEEGKEVVFKIRRGKKRKTQTITVVPRSEEPFFGFSCLPGRYYSADKKLKETLTYLKGKKYIVFILSPTIWTNGVLYVNLEVRNLSDEEVTFDPNQVSVLAAGIPLRMLSCLEAKSRTKIEQFKKKIAARSIQKRETLKPMHRKKFYLYSLKQSIKEADIKSGEATKGIIAFDNYNLISDIKFIIKVGDEAFKARFDEFMRYTPK